MPTLASVVFCAFVQSQADPARQVRELVEQLGADQIEVREAATARLKESADPADPDLERAIRGQDPEAALRAREILRAALFRRGGPIRQVADLLEHAWSAFLEGDLDGATRFCGALLAADPRFPAARELQKAVRRAGENEEDFREAVRQIWKSQSEAEIHLRAFQLPSRAEWPALSTSLASAFWRAQHPGSDKPVTFQASNEEMEKIIREVARGRSQEEQAKFAESQQLFRVALTYHTRGEFEKARIEAVKAVEAWHENVPARKLLNDVQQIMVGGKAEFGARSIAEGAAGSFHGPIEWVSLEINKHVRDGGRYFNAKMYDEAIREFETAEFKIKEIPYEVKAAQDLLPGIKESIIKSRNALMVEERRVEAEKKLIVPAEDRKRS